LISSDQVRSNEVTANDRRLAVNTKSGLTVSFKTTLLAAGKTATGIEVAAKVVADLAPLAVEEAMG
jgi:hypothetical protein